MSMPLFFCSSKPASTGPLAMGHAHATSSSPADAGRAGAGAGAGAMATLGADAAEAGRVAALAALAGGKVDDAAGVEDAAVAGGKARASDTSGTGGATRSTWPTSMTFGLSMLFQRATSR